MYRSSLLILYTCIEFLDCLCSLKICVNFILSVNVRSSARRHCKTETKLSRPREDYSLRKWRTFMEIGIWTLFHFSILTHSSPFYSLHAEYYTVLGYSRIQYYISYFYEVCKDLWGLNSIPLKNKQAWWHLKVLVNCLYLMTKTDEFVKFYRNPDEQV